MKVLISVAILLGLTKETEGLKYSGVRMIKDLRDEMIQTDSIHWDESVTAYMNDKEYISDQQDVLNEQHISNPARYEMSIEKYQQKLAQQEQQEKSEQDLIIQKRVIKQKQEEIDDKRREQIIEDYYKSKELKQIQNSTSSKLSQDKNGTKLIKSNSTAASKQQQIVQVLSESQLKEKQLSEELNKFSSSLKEEDYQQAIKTFQELKSMGKNIKEESLKLNLCQKIKKGFTSFPQIGDNEYVREQLDFLQAAEDNLVSNLDNHKLMLTLLNVNNEVVANIKSKYDYAWDSPFKN